MRNYCTYFDRNYSARALALIDSLNRFGGDYCLYALCLDEDSLFIMKTLGKNRVVSVILGDLENFDPDLAQTKSSRSLIEYYFTITPCWLSYIFQKFPEVDQLTYLDADLYFFSDPEPVFEEIGEASVGLTPHNFSPDRATGIQFGEYNMGWMTWRRDENGLAALNWYRERCLEWCFDRVEGDKFADQKYLDAIARMPGVKRIENIGVNIGEWCCNKFELTLEGDSPVVDGQPVVCYHFQQLWLIGPNEFDCNFPKRHSDPNSIMVTHMFQPYCERLAYLLSMARKLSPEVSLDRTKRAIPGSRGKLEPGSLGNGAIGWNTAEIVQTRIEQWHEIINGLESGGPVGQTVWDHHMFVCFGYVLGRAMQGKPGLSILDWGGAFGHFALYAKHLYPGLEIDYTCKEVPLLCEQGRLLNCDAKFVDNDEEALSRDYDLILANSSLQYCDDWLVTFGNLAKAARPWIFISRLHLVEQAQSCQFTDQAYGSNVQVWLIDRTEFLEAAEKLGLVTHQDMATFETVQTPIGKIEGSAFLFEKIADA